VTGGWSVLQLTSSLVTQVVYGKRSMTLLINCIKTPTGDGGYTPSVCTIRHNWEDMHVVTCRVWSWFAGWRQISRSI